MGHARDRERHFLCFAWRHSLAVAAEGFPPWQTVYRWFARLRDACVFERMNHALVMADRQRVGREGTLYVPG